MNDSRVHPHSIARKIQDDDNDLPPELKDGGWAVTPFSQDLKTKVPRLKAGLLSEPALALKLSDPFLRALHFRTMGLNTIPLVSGKKCPAVKWAHYRYSGMGWPTFVDLLWKAHARNYGIGVLLGQQMTNGKYLAEMDCDTPEAFNLGQRLFAGRDTMIYQGARGNGKIWFSTDEPVEPITKNAQGWEIKSIGQQTVTPGSLHPSGKIYKILSYNGVITNLGIEEIPELGLSLSGKYARGGLKDPGRQVWKILHGKVGIRRKPGEQNDHDFTITDDDDAEYDSASEAEGAAVLIMRLKDFSFSDVQFFFNKIHADSKYRRLERDKSPKRALEYLKNLYSSAGDLISAWNNSPVTVQGRIRKLVKYAFQIDWNWRGGRTDHHVYAAMLKIARQSNSFEFHASLDALRIETGDSRGAIHNAISRLKDYGLIRISRPHTTFYATRFELNQAPKRLVRHSFGRYTHAIESGDPFPDEEQRQKEGISDFLNTLQEGTHCVAECSRSENRYLELLGTDLFLSRRGRKALAICESLLKFGDAGAKITELSQKSGISWRALKTGLEWMKEKGLLTTEGRIYRLVGRDKIQDIVQRSQSLGLKNEIIQEVHLRRCDRLIKLRLIYLERRGITLANVETGEVLV